MARESVAIHTNPNLKHQVEFAEYISSGLKRHGKNPSITSDRNSQADIHIVLGPHYAKQNCLNLRTILLDRGFWGDPAREVSLAWMTNNGGRVMIENADADRPKPELKHWKYGERIIELVDFGGQPTTSHTIRLHPSTRKPSESLDIALSRHDIAIGGIGTAMVTAAIYGLPVVCSALSVCAPIASKSTDDLNRPCRKQWLNNLSYMNWSGSEIESGEAFEHLL